MHNNIKPVDVMVMKDGRPDSPDVVKIVIVDTIRRLK